MTADERLGIVLAVFVPSAAERLLVHAGVEPESALALARAPRRDRLAALADAARLPRLAGAAIADLLAAERAPLRQLAATRLELAPRAAAPAAGAAGVLRRLVLEQLVSR